MINVEIISNGEKTLLQANAGDKLSDVLICGGFYMPHPCGGRGDCGKCAVKVNGERVLSCEYNIRSDISVTLPSAGKTAAVTGLNGPAVTDGEQNAGMRFIALDIGSTTLAAALVVNGETVRTVTADNPQTAFGADVISRIEYCTANGVSLLRECLLDRIGSMTSDLTGNDKIKQMFVAGNTAMLHIFTGTDVSSLGVSPYKPVFLEEKHFPGTDFGFDDIETVITLPGYSGFVGADIFAGLCFAGMPEKGKKTLLLDLGTNSEIALLSENEAVCTSAAAGPCFEGAGISCGMTACDGAVSRFFSDGSFSVIGDTEPEGLCATGLIDLISLLLERGLIDETGRLSDGYYPVSDDFGLSAKDVRCFQLAKSAVISAIRVLLDETGTAPCDIDRFCVAGGFSAEINYGNAVRTGLLPEELSDKFIPVRNSSLAGTVRFGICSCPEIPRNARYLDMGPDKRFFDEYMENMNF